MSLSTEFDHVAGYDDLLERRTDRQVVGSDFSDAKGKVQGQIDAMHPHRIPMVISEIIQETPTAKTFRLTPRDGRDLPVFQAGQYVNLFLTVDGVDTARPFAISSAPNTRTHYDLTVRAVPEGFVSPFMLDHLAVGDAVSTTGPMGTFHYHPVFQGAEIVFLAGGSGIAPAISMARAFADKTDRPNLHIIYGSRTEDDVIFHDELKRMAEAHEFLTVTEVISDPSEGYQGHRGFINADKILELVGAIGTQTFFICGPTVMNDFCRAALQQLGVAEKRIRVEANGPPRKPESEPDWPVEIDSQKTVTIRVKGHGSFASVAGEPVLTALERNGFGAENACRSGECSLCRLRLVSGKVYHPPQAKVRLSDRQFGWIHSCVAYPTEDIEIEL